MLLMTEYDGRLRIIGDLVPKTGGLTEDEET